MSAFLVAAAAPPLLALALHQLIPALPPPDPTSIRPFALGPYDHVGELTFAAFSGLAALASMLAALAGAIVLFRLGPAWIRLTRREWIGFGLIAGGILANGGEALLRGAVIDWVWFSPDGRTAIIFNTADGALLLGLLLILPRVVGDLTALVRRVG